MTNPEMALCLYIYIRIQAIDRCSVADILSRETWWIHRLKSLKITDGLNVDPGVTRLQNSLNN